MNKLVSLSIVVPCHDEAAVVATTYMRLKQLIDNWMGRVIKDYELVLVNNGSTDETLAEMMKLYQFDPHVVVLDLRKNYGYQGSISAGLFHSTKEAVVSIDADLQDDPAIIEEMLAKYYDGFELVLGVRDNRQNDTFIKRSTAELYYRLLNYLGVKSVINHGDFRLLSRPLVEELKSMPEKNRYLRGLVFELESKYAVVTYSRARREAGRSKFNFVNLISLALDGITSFSNLPIRLVSLLGIGMFSLSFIGLVAVIIMKLFFNVQTPGWASLAVSLLFFTGMQSFLIGIVGEYIAKIFVEVKGRPLFLVRKKYERERL